MVIDVGIVIGVDTDITSTSTSSSSIDASIRINSGMDTIDTSGGVEFEDVGRCECDYGCLWFSLLCSRSSRRG